jgi:hypothetical protein
VVISIQTHIGCPNVKELNRRSRTRLLPVIRELAGFKSFALAKLDDDTVTFIIMFTTQKQLEAASQKLNAMIRAELDRLAPNPPEVLLGDVLWETRW